MSGLRKFPSENEFIGRLLTRYTDLELGLLNCVQVATGDFDSALKSMYGKRGETRRIKEGENLGRQPYRALGLELEFDQAITAMRFCLKIRNQYAHHTFWDDNSGQLAIGALEEVAKQPTPVKGLSGISVEHIDVPLLRAQEQYFEFADALFAWTNFEGRFQRGLIAAASRLPKPLIMAKPSLHL